MVLPTYSIVIGKHFQSIGISGEKITHAYGSCGYPSVNEESILSIKWD